MKYNITVTPSEHGTVTVEETTVEYNGQVELTITPDPGYELVEITASDDGYISGNWLYVYGDVTITATFAPVTYTITSEETENGTVEIDKQTAGYGETVTVTTTPDEHYQLESVVVDGVAIEGNTFTVTEDTVITVTFRLAVFTVEIGYEIPYSCNTHS